MVLLLFGVGLGVDFCGLLFHSLCFSSLPGFCSKDIAMNAPEVERKVKDATSNEKWGPTGTQMQEISKATYHLYAEHLFFCVYSSV